MVNSAERIESLLAAVYGKPVAREVMPRLIERLDRYAEVHPLDAHSPSEAGERLTERDVILITYGDQIQEPGKPPLRTLDEMEIADNTLILF